MKKKISSQSLILILLVAFLFSALSISAFAADNNIQSSSQDDFQYQIANTDEENIKELIIKDKNGVINKKVHIALYTSDKAYKITDEVIKSVYQYADDAYQKEMKFDKSGRQKGTFNYYLVGTDELFFYEQTEAKPQDAEMLIHVLSEEEKQEIEAQIVNNNLEQKDLNDSPITPFYTGPYPTSIPDGIGGRVQLANTSNKYLSANVMLPSASELSYSPASASPAYIYGGFAGGKPSGTYSSYTFEGDIGLQYSHAYNLWKPYMLLTGNASGTRIQFGQTFLSPYNQVQNLNGYLPGTTVNMVIHPKNDQTGTAGTVRLKTYGTAKYADMHGNGGNTPLTSISESAVTNNGSLVVLNISSVSFHKLVATIIGENTTGKNIARFTSININGTTVPHSSMALYYENATFSNIANGSVTITVQK